MFYQTQTAHRQPKLTFDLNLQTPPSEGPNTSSLWILHKSSGSRDISYRLQTKRHRQRQKQNLTQFPGEGSISGQIIKGSTHTTPHALMRAVTYCRLQPKLCFLCCPCFHVDADTHNEFVVIVKDHAARDQRKLRNIMKTGRKPSKTSTVVRCCSWTTHNYKWSK